MKEEFDVVAVATAVYLEDHHLLENVEEQGLEKEGRYQEEDQRREEASDEDRRRPIEKSREKEYAEHLVLDLWREMTEEKEVIPEVGDCQLRENWKKRGVTNRDLENLKSRREKVKRNYIKMKRVFPIKGRKVCRKIAPILRIELRKKIGIVSREVVVLKNPFPYRHMVHLVIL